MECKEALCKAEQLDRKRSNILHNLQKLNDSTDPEAYLDIFKAAMTDGYFDQKDGLPAQRNLLTGKALSFFRELAVTEETLNRSFKTSFLERRGCTIKQARKMQWNNYPGNDTNLREHIQPILRVITRLVEHLSTKADFTAELFQGCLSAYYSPDAIYNLRHSDPKDSFQMVEELQDMWELKPTWERSRIQKLRADVHTHYSQPRHYRDRCTGPRDANRTPFREGEHLKSKCVVKSAGQSWGWTKGKACRVVVLRMGRAEQAHAILAGR